MTRSLSTYNEMFYFPYIDLGTSFVEFWIHNQTWHIHTKKATHGYPSHKLWKRERQWSFKEREKKRKT